MLRRSVIDIKSLAKECNISEMTATILVNRGLTTAMDINKFMRASLEDLYDPFLMKDMRKAVDIIIEGIEGNKKIVVYGDYDADGVTSTSILYKALSHAGAKVSYYIPDREQEGYGMSTDRIGILKEEGTDIIITCDNGISAIEQVKTAKELGMTIVVTDHHEVGFVEDEKGNREYVLPEADALVNPKQKECKYPFKLLCGAGIAYKFSQGLFKSMGLNGKVLEELLQFAGIGTICDIVDLFDENRILAKNALQYLNNTENVGLQALVEVLGLKDKKISAGTIGFQIGPCINATGRLETANLSVDLLLSEDKERALELANTLNDLNKKRQEMTNESAEQIIAELEASGLKNQKVIVAYNKNIHESIAGIVAGKVREKYNLPTIVLTAGKEMPKGSGRSIDEYNLFEELLKCKECIENFGGHPMAAGLSLKEENIPRLRKMLNENCKLTEDDITPKIRIDKQVNVMDLTFDELAEIESLEPYGKGNTSPLLGDKGLSINRINIYKKNIDTLKFVCNPKGDYRSIDGICFGRLEEFETMLKERYGINYEKMLANPLGMKMDFVFYPSVNEFQGRKSIQMKIVDFRISN